MDYLTRLSRIVETAYEVVCYKIAERSIDIFNEASLQLHIGSIMSSIGHLYEFSSSDIFVIDLEKRIEGFKGTAKSNNVARCDIVLSFKIGERVHARAFLELKFFKASNESKSAEATKDNRFGLFEDLENLEIYRSLFKGESKEGAPLCYEIAIAENGTYSNPKSRSSLNIGNGKMTNDSKDKNGLITYASRKPVQLEGNYKFCWTTYRTDLYSLIVRLQ